MDDVAIKVDHVSKTFKLPHEKQNSIKGALISLVKGGKRTYERQEVLKDVSFEIKQGEFFGILGRNGSGKSTLLKMLAGIYAPSKGAIHVNGKLTPFIELGVGFNPELTGRENVYLNGALLGFSRADMLAMYDDIVEFAELERFMDQKLKNYSSGMQVRLAFSIAIRAQSDILLLDEVLAVGDENFQKKCFDYFNELKRTKQTVILVSHDMATVEKYCDRAMLVESGELLDIGDTRGITAKYRLLNLPADTSEDSRKSELSGGTKIDSVTANGQGETVVKERQEIQLQVVFTPKETDNYLVGMSIFKSDGTHIAYYDNSEVSKGVKFTKGEKHITICTFPADQLAVGAYLVDIEIYCGEAYVASKTKAVSFAVTDGQSNKSGLINLQGSWSLKQQ